MLEGAEKMEGEVVTRADGGRGLVEAGVVVGGGWVGRVRGGSVVEGIMWKDVRRWSTERKLSSVARENS